MNKQPPQAPPASRIPGIASASGSGIPSEEVGFLAAVTVAVGMSMSTGSCKPAPSSASSWSRIPIRKGRVTPERRPIAREELEENQLGKSVLQRKWDSGRVVSLLYFVGGSLIAEFFEDGGGICNGNNP